MEIERAIRVLEHYRNELMKTENTQYIAEAIEIGVLAIHQVDLLKTFANERLNELASTWIEEHRPKPKRLELVKP
jgi:hypothetical protein